MDNYEAFAVGHYLSSYPEDWSFESILSVLQFENSEIRIRDIYEAIPPEDLAFLIKQMAIKLKSFFPEEQPEVDDQQALINDLQDKIDIQNEMLIRAGFVIGAMMPAFMEWKKYDEAMDKKKQEVLKVIEKLFY